MHSVSQIKRKTFCRFSYRHSLYENLQTFHRGCISDTLYLQRTITSTVLFHLLKPNAPTLRIDWGMQCGWSRNFRIERPGVILVSHFTGKIGRKEENVKALRHNPASLPTLPLNGSSLPLPSGGPNRSFSIRDTSLKKNPHTHMYTFMCVTQFYPDN